MRDGLRGVVSKDFDFATSAEPRRVQGLFAKTLDHGIRFGTVVVVENGHSFEVTTFRQDLPYKDGRHPEGIRFSSPEEDAARRDFTINALFYDWDTQSVIDFVGGEQDLQQKCIRAVGEARQRFLEDHLRILRALRFAAELQFKIEEKTWIALRDLSGQLESISGERIFGELRRWCMAATPVQVDQLMRSGVLPAILPNWKERDPWQSEDPRELSFWFWLVEKQPELLPKLHQRLHLPRQLHRDLERVFDVLQMNLASVSVGELVEMSFDVAKNFALQKRSEASVCKALQLSREWQTKPEPWVKAADVQAQGSRLGEILRKTYWAQLDRTVRDRDEALHFAHDLK